MSDESLTSAARLAAPRRAGVAVAGPSAFVPLLLPTLALAGWLGFQTYQLVVERNQLTQVRAGQDASMEAATRLRASLDATASATARLADGGNANARAIVDELRKRGITINPDAPTAAPAK
jgi:cell division septation protein DedD